MDQSPATAIFEQLHVLATRFRNRIRDSVASVDQALTFNGMRVLMRAGRQPGITQKELVEHSQADKAQMARIIDHLHENGWLERTPCEHDRRVRRLHLTKQGRALYGKLERLQDRVAAEMLEACEPAVQQELLSLLQQAARDS
jgi:DNA-binding MarR family transcriptional regulator